MRPDGEFAAELIALVESHGSGLPGKPTTDEEVAAHERGRESSGGAVQERAR